MAFAQGFSSELSVLWDNNFEYKILSYYLNIHNIPCIINSPLRVDANPSFSIYSSSSGTIGWRDFGTGEFGNLRQLLKRLWNTSIQGVEAKLLLDTKKILAREHNVEVIHTHSIKGRIVHSKLTDLQVKVREWKSYDLEYWSNQGLSKEWLEFGNIYPISHILVTKNSHTNTIPAEKYAYVFVEFKDNIPTLKIYQPFSTTFKWTNKHDQSVWDLWAQLPKEGAVLIITSSRKDALCIWANTGIPCVSLQGEGYIPKAHVVESLVERFNQIFILYDNDFRSEINYGREFGKKLSQLFGLKQIEIPSSYHSKDPSDLYQSHGRDVLQQVIFDLIKTQKINKGDCPF